MDKNIHKKKTSQKSGQFLLNTLYLANRKWFHLLNKINAVILSKRLCLFFLLMIFLHDYVCIKTWYGDNWKKKWAKNTKNENKDKFPTHFSTKCILLYWCFYNFAAQEHERHDESSDFWGQSNLGWHWTQKHADDFPWSFEDMVGKGFPGWPKNLPLSNWRQPQPHLVWLTDKNLW